jgi:hypothetical protein
MPTRLRRACCLRQSACAATVSVAAMGCLLIELRETEIAALIRKDLLKPDARNDLSAVRDALYSYLDRTLGAAS